MYPDSAHTAQNSMGGFSMKALIRNLFLAGMLYFLFTSGRFLASGDWVSILQQCGNILKIFLKSLQSVLLLGQYL